MREPLTLEQSRAKFAPEPFTRAEWDAMWRASAAGSEAIRERTVWRVLQEQHDLRRRADNYWLNEGAFHG